MRVSDRKALAGNVARWNREAGRAAIGESSAGARRHGPLAQKASVLSPWAQNSPSMAARSQWQPKNGAAVPVRRPCGCKIRGQLGTVYGPPSGGVLVNTA